MQKSDWEHQIGYVIELIKEHNFEVLEKPGMADQVNLDECCVYINSSCWPETRFYTLLHEYGHMEIWLNGGHDGELPLYVHAEFHDGRRAGSNAYRVSLLGEEYEAWRLGRRLAREHGLHVDDDKFNRHMTDALMSYIQTAAR